MHWVTPLETLLIQGANELLMVVNSEGLAIQTFEKIDSCFFRNALATDNFANLSAPVRELSVQSRIMWTASIRMALSGQPYAVAPLLRTALEAACYASLINSDSSLGRVWLDRHRDKDSMKKSRKDFSPAVSDVAKIINTASPSLAASILEAYDECINDGAHPNTRSIPRTPKIYVGPHGIDEVEETSDFYELPSRKTKYALASIAHIGLLNVQIICLMIMQFQNLPNAEIEEIRLGVEELRAEFM